MFQLYSLGWHNFQQLCLSILREILGQTVEAFLDSNDGGRDGAFSGTWSPKPGQTFSGKFVVQCKFTNRVGYNLQPSDLTDEVVKAKRLVSQDRCDFYLLLTNGGVSGTADIAIRQVFETVGVKSTLIFASTWIEQQIKENQRLRMMVPRIYGLGDLSQILDARAYGQAAAVLESMHDDLSKVVVTDAYRRAAEALNVHGFVLLIGEPAAGKTTIASLLAMASIDQNGSSVLKLDDADAVADRWNPHEPSQFIWVDDAFGVTQYESSLVLKWNHKLQNIRAFLRKGGRLVLTSRDYVYNRARRELKEGSFPLFRESQVVINVHDLNPTERKQILYNHIKRGNQSPSFRAEIKPYLKAIAAHRRFIPEIARRLADSNFTQKLRLTDRGVNEFVDRREQFLIDVCNELDADSKAALAMVYMRNGRLVSPIEIAGPEEDALQRLGSSLGGCVTALDALRGSLLEFTRGESEHFWHFKHPTIGDAYSGILRSSPELLGIYVSGSDIEKLMTQVTCGDVQLQGAVVLPERLFPQMIRRLASYKATSRYKENYLARWGARRDVLTFMGRRCGKAFLAQYLAQDPGFVASVELRSGLEYSEEAAFLVALRKHGLLEEEARQAAACKLIALAVDGEDAHVLVNDDLRALLTAEEVEHLRDAMRTRLVPRLDEVRAEFESSHFLGDDPKWRMRRFEEMLTVLQAAFPSSLRIKRRLVRQRQAVAEWISENPEPDVEDVPRDEVTSSPEASIGTDRDIFDDIDE